MLNKHYQVYLDNTYTLARSIMLKSDYAAQRINDLMLIKHGDGFYDPNDRATWKYYLNLCGEYHSTDAPIYVNSFDTHETIAFTKDNLAVHANTKQEYRVGTAFHKELISLYSEQEILIRGVLTPIEMRRAIDCDEFTIVSLANDYIEDNEYSLFENLQDFIKRHAARYHNRQFTISDDMYYGTYLATLMMYCVMNIITHRLKMAKTSETHSFHVMQYLSSHSKIGEHYKNLSHEQRMFFMRNIRYIERRTGIKENFNWLRTNLMDAINMPLASFETRHDLSAMPGAIKPLLRFKKVPINTKHNVDRVDDYALTDIMDLSDSLASLNSSMRATEEADFKRKAEHAISNNTTVKLLESTTISDEGNERYPLQELALQHWLHLSSIDVYKATIEVRVKSSGLVIELDAKNAFILFIYSFCKSIKKTLLRVPKLTASRVIHYEKPSFDTLRALADSAVVSDAQIDELLSEVPVGFTEIYSVSAFNSYCEKLFKMANTHIVRSEVTASLKQRPQYYNVLARLWGDNTISNLYGQSYTEWFKENNIEFESLTVGDLESMWKDIFQAATNLEINKQGSLQSVQSSVIRLFMQLSSYSIRLVGNVKSGAAIKAGPSAIRYGAITLRSNDSWKIHSSNVRILDFKIDQTASIFDNLKAGGVSIRTSNLHEHIQITRKLTIGQKPRNVATSTQTHNRYQIISKMKHSVIINSDTINQTDNELI